MDNQKRKHTPVQDPAIVAFEHENLYSNHCFISPLQTVTNVCNLTRETGIIEKLLHTYGFIQCCDGETRLFFHFSEYSGEVESMAVGDQVSFQVSLDKRTGKPIATSVEKTAATSQLYDLATAQCLIGSIAQIAHDVDHTAGGSQQDGFGRVGYESHGEHFFLPYSAEDVAHDNVVLKVGDQIVFNMVTDKSNGNVRAANVALLSVPLRHQGVVCSMKDSFGFIERADEVSEIFFHYSEYQGGDINQLVPGDDVEFSIQTRNNKDVAVEIFKLEPGTVIFDDVGVEKRRGRILQVLDHNKSQTDPLSGRIIYETVSGSIEIPFGDKDQVLEYTLLESDIVEFNIATDRRDHLQRGTNITLIEDTFTINKEKRETGKVVSVKDGFGFISCAERDARIFFHFSEFLDGLHEVRLSEEVQFTVIPDPQQTNRQVAVRIRRLPKGTVVFNNSKADVLQGVITKEANSLRNSANKKNLDAGVITYEENSTKLTIPYLSKSVTGGQPKYGDRVEFRIVEIKRNGNSSRHATGIRQVLVRSNSTSSAPAKMYGFIAAMKDSYGFIESAEHDREIFFHFRNVDGEATDLDIGDEVEYALSRKTSRLSAENISKLSPGTVAPEELLQGEYEGRIVRCMRIVDPQQEEYAGLVRNGADGDGGEEYPFSVTSLTDKRDFLQIGDHVKFNLCKVISTGAIRTTNMAAVRKYIQAKVDSIKGQYGFLNYEAEEGKKLFFHITEIVDGTTLQHGDTVEFVLVQNQKTGKFSACNLHKIVEKQRPNRLISRLKSTSEESGPKVLIIRQPRGPDGTSGFNLPRVQRVN